MTSTESGSGSSRNRIRMATLLVVVIAVIGVLTFKSRNEAQTSGSAVTPESALEDVTSEDLPRLVDLGADKCVPCKMMAPILEELQADLVGQCSVAFIDVWKNPDEGPKYGIKVIPTQIFFGSDGEEFFRHEGFFSREDILATFAEHGFLFDLVDAESDS